MKKIKFVLFYVVLVLAVLGGVSAQPEVNESTISVDVLTVANDSFVLRGETLRVSFNFTEAVNATPDAEIDLWVGGSKNLSRSVSLLNTSTSNVSYVFDYVINSSDPDADYLEINVGNACNSSGSCNDLSPKRLNVSVISRSNFVSVSSTSNVVDALRKTESGGTITFSAGTYNGFKLGVNKPVTLVSDTGDYRTSGTVITGNDVLFWIASNDVTLKGFRFENIAIRSNLVGSWTHDGVIRVAAYHSNLRFEKNKFENMTAHSSSPGTPLRTAGIEFIHGHNRNVFVIDNKYVNNKGGFVRSRSLNDAVFEGNVIDNIPESTSAGFYHKAGRNLSFLNNRISFSEWGIFIDNVHDANITGNVIESIDLTWPHTWLGVRFQSPIRVTGSSSGTIENNTITNSQDGIILCDICYVNNPSTGTNGGTATFSLTNNRIYNLTGGYHLLLGVNNPRFTATYNYWGSPRGPAANYLWGNIVHSPFYTDESLSNLGFILAKDNLTSGPNVFHFSDDDARSALQNVSINLSANVSRLEMVAMVLGSRPKNAARVHSSMGVYRYLEITDDLDDSLLTSANVTFRVPKSWLNSSGIDRDTVVLMWDDGSVWRNLDTVLVNESSDWLIFSAETPGFSFFAIAGTLPPVPSGGRPGSSDNDDGSNKRIIFPGFNKVRGKIATTSGKVVSGVPFEYDLRGEGLSVREVRMTLDGTHRVSLTVSDLIRRSATEKPSGDVHNYFGTHLSRAVERNAERFTMTFAVNKNWLSVNGFEKDEVVLLMRESGGWKEMGTEAGAENPTEIEFSSNASLPLKGPLIFAVAGRKKENPKEIEEERETKTEPEKKDVDKEETTPPVVPVTDEVKDGGHSWTWFFYVLAVVVVVLAVVLFLLRRRYLRDKGDE